MKKNNEMYKKKAKMRNNLLQKKEEYICIFHCPITVNDCINSIDLKEDKVIIGTLMGDVYLCRVDESKLNVIQTNKIVIPPLNIGNILQGQKDDDSNLQLNNKLNNKLSDNNEEIKEIKFPKITQIINRSRENIPCIEFETNDIINICIGDLEIIHLEKMSTFNKNDKNSTYNFSKLRNYKTENDHIEFCETATCFLKNSFFLIIFTKFAEFDEMFEITETKYENKNLNTGEIIKGNIRLSNFVIPFDFDGDLFLFIDFLSKEEKFIGIIYTLTKRENYIYKINDVNFGHISHMKLITEKTIFLIRNEIQCEIRYLNEDFDCIEKFEHVGNDIISCSLYKNENMNSLIDLINDDIKEKSDENDLNKSKVKLESNILRLFENNKNNVANTNNKQKIFSYINIDQTVNKKNKSRTKKKNNLQNVSNIYQYKEKKMITSLDNNNNNKYSFIKTEDKSSVKKDGSVNKFFTVDNNLLNKSNTFLRYNMSIPLKKIEPEKNVNGFSSIEIFDIKKDKENLRYKKEYKTIIKHNDDYKIYKIIILDSNGTVFLYHNNIQINLFNIYDIENIKQKYKDIKFFSLGFPYYIIANDKYICITTDFGLLVFSKIDD